VSSVGVKVSSAMMGESVVVMVDSRFRGSRGFAKFEVAKLSGARPRRARDR
jgi:hypothetical protein